MTLIHPEGGGGVGVYSWIPQSSCFDESAKMLALKHENHSMNSYVIYMFSGFIYTEIPN